ncbi:MAG: hypothetical protein L6Q29_04910 [Candidatus Pacebacteria bacterium]|nr:hypothetical protein [Candidatus Paceibacterota bacterium]
MSRKEVKGKALFACNDASSSGCAALARSATSTAETKNFCILHDLNFVPARQRPTPAAC